MAQLTPKRRIANLLRRAPWIMGSVQRVWGLTRPRYSLGVVGVLIDDDQRVLLVEHVFHARTPWGLPGGWVDWGEDPDATLQRELREELELDVEVGPLLLFERDRGLHIDLAYRCHARGGIGRLSAELLTYRWTPFSDLPALSRFHQRAVEAARAADPALSQAHRLSQIAE
jgi:ADP-ribose pyrophosphatase YjhB (NUDIX family)